MATATEAVVRTTISINKSAADQLRLLAIDRRVSVSELFDELFQAQLDKAYQQFISREHAELSAT